jgi:hypothetical protein
MCGSDNKKPFRYCGKDFIFRGLLTCGTKGKMVTADTKKRIYKKGESAELTYLRCWKPLTMLRKSCG